MNSDIFNRYADLVCTAYDTDMEELLSKKRSEEITDARCVLCYILNKQGLNKNIIAQQMGLSQPGVTYLLDRFELRTEQSTYFNNILEWIKRKINESSVKG